MYFENNRRTSCQRANDDFLRRMLGGELTQEKRGGCSLQKKQQETSCRTPRQEMQGMPSTPSCEARPSCPIHPGSSCAHNCPTQIPAPAIAMVYVPRQCWHKILEPATGLSKGSIFSDLILPLEGKCPANGKEGKPCRPM